MADGRKNNGGARHGAGRPTKAEEQEVVEQLSPLDELFVKGIKKAMQAGESWAFKLFADYRHGKPTQRIEQTGKDGQPQQIQIFTVPGPVMPTNEDDIDEDITP
jgi:hypothetical protein